MRTAIIGLALLEFLVAPARAVAAPVRLNGADIHGRAVQLDGRVVAITFASRYTGDEAEQVNNQLMQDVGSGVGMVSVVDFTGIPELFFGMARQIIATWSPKTPAALVIDERGSWGATLGALPGKRVDILVLDRHGELRGHFIGLGQVDAARRLIRALRDAPRVATR